MRNFVALIAIVLVACGGPEEEEPVEEGPPTEGEPCLVNVGCELPYFCVSEGCVDNAAGTCLPVPEDCSTERISPVCACDGETYDNRCEAHRLRRNVRIAGPCQ